MEENQQPESSSTPAAPPTAKPVLTKAFASVICGVLSIPSCFLMGVPAILLGALAVWLGAYCRKAFRNNNAVGEVANLYGWIGTILGSIGILLGVIMLAMVILGAGAGVAVQEDWAR